MKITQCYISESISDFPIRQKYNLDQYSDSLQPCVFFGMYRKEDLRTLLSHNGICIIRWSGQDALKFTDWDELRRPNVFHITPFPAISRILLLNGFDCKLIYPPKLDRIPNPLILGNSVYAYCPSSAKEYHGYSLIEKLSKSFDIIIGDGSISMDQWPSVCDLYYSQCFAGIVLNNHAGGGASIVEMGLRGMNVLTNVLCLPHTNRWDTYEDIEFFLLRQKQISSGKTNYELANQVYQTLDDEMPYLYTEYYV